MGKAGYKGRTGNDKGAKSKDIAIHLKNTNKHNLDHDTKQASKDASQLLQLYKYKVDYTSRISIAREREDRER